MPSWCATSPTIKGLIGSQAAQIVDARAAGRLRGHASRAAPGTALRPYSQLPQRALSHAAQCRWHAEARCRSCARCSQRPASTPASRWSPLRLGRHRRRHRPGARTARPARCAVYDGSWTEWGRRTTACRSRPDLPRSKGPNPLQRSGRACHPAGRSSFLLQPQNCAATELNRRGVVSVMAEFGQVTRQGHLAPRSEK